MTTNHLFGALQFFWAPKNVENLLILVWSPISLISDIYSYVCVYKLVGSLDWFKGKSTGNHGFYHQI